MVIETTGAFGQPTKALATLPNVALSQGIYRPSEFYMTRTDVRVDQFSDFDTAVAVEAPNNPGFLLCGSPVGVRECVGLADGRYLCFFFDNSIDPADAPAAGLIASAETQPGICLPAPSPSSSTLTSVSKSKKANGTASRPTATPQMALHGEVIDATAGTYDPSVDGVFSAEAYNDGEVPVSHTSDPTLTRPGLCHDRHIDSFNQHPGYACPSGNGHDPGGNITWLGTTCSDV